MILRQGQRTWFKLGYSMIVVADNPHSSNRMTQMIIQEIDVSDNNIV